MNAFIIKMLMHLPAWDLVRWCLAETGYQRDVAQWLAVENAWYFKLAATAWGATYVADPNALRAVLLEDFLKGMIQP